VEKVVVTGAAGFIGSHLCERLLEEGFEVTGVDSLSDYYDVRIKRDNLAGSLEHQHFTFVEQTLNAMDLDELLEGASYVFHQAAQAGVRKSWGKDFDEYIEANIRATQKLLEAAKGKKLKKLVYASSSSVYGDTVRLPMSESHLVRPVSPYGVTKLSGENLCLLYKKNYLVPVVALRYFTVYGPRQRPDMAFHKFILGALLGRPVEIYGNGTQTRDFTYIDDIVEANILAAKYSGEESIFNIGGGSRITLNVVLDIINECCNGKLDVRYSDPVRGDVMHTFADISLAQREMEYIPKMALQEGIQHEVEWVEYMHRKLEV
jgi:nucleoside-diphosphate-sugar epimerase